jgi:alcohol dehydrogenase
MGSPHSGNPSISKKTLTMKAVVYHEFGGVIATQTVRDPSPAADGAVIQVEATGLCRSDWHGWRGHDPDIKQFPHVPGHEFAGVVVAIGSDVRRAAVGQRVTIPFVAGCGTCEECRRGNQHICDRQYQPGFTGWGSFAEYVAVRYADGNLVPLPENISNIAAAALGCRLATAYRAVFAHGAVQPGEWVAIHGCGGVGLSATMVAHAFDARVVAVDVRDEPLELARNLGAGVVLNAGKTPDIPAAIHEITGGGADVSLDALGSATTFANSIRSLRKRGRHVQVGILTKRDEISATLINRIIGRELVIAGSHGLQAHAYPGLLDLIQAGRLDPMRLIDRQARLDEAPGALAAMDDFIGTGVTVFTPFS